MAGRRSSIFAVYVLIHLCILALLWVHAQLGQSRARPDLELKREMVGSLGLTDLCLFTEARYTRHPAMADSNAPFQDHPMSFDQFPSGAIVTVPEHLRYESGKP